MLLLVTSDGAGSASHSQEGSQLACEQTLRWLELRLTNTEGPDDFLEQDDGIKLVRALRTLLVNRAEDLGVPERELACTLNVAALLPGRAWCLQVGDGAMITQAPGEGPQVVFWPDNGEYANQTYFITDVPDAHVHVAVLVGELDRVALLTDGLQTLALALRDRAAHAPFFEPMFRAVEALEGSGSDPRLNEGLTVFLDSAAVNDRTSDDKTLILASLRTAKVTPTPI